MLPIFEYLKEEYDIDLTQKLHEIAGNPADSNFRDLPLSVYENIANDYQLIYFQYQVFKRQLSLHCREGKRQAGFEEKLIALLLLSTLLEQVNTYYFSVGRESLEFSADRAFYIHKLNEIIQIATDNKSYQRIYKPDFSKKIREVTTTMNWPRLFIVRLKRVADAAVPLLKAATSYKNFVLFIDNIANPVFAWLAWIFYIPRFMTNAYFVLKHLMPGHWMREEEKLPWHFQLKLQMKERGFELVNDTVWMLVGLINCFILVGALAPAAAYLTLALYAFDVGLAALKAYIEIGAMDKMQRHYNTYQNTDALKEYCQLLQEQISYQKQMLVHSLLTATGLFLSVALSVPFFFAITPVIPLIGVSLVVAVCLVSFASAKYIQSHKPQNQLPEFEPSRATGAKPSAQGLFSEKAQHQDNKLSCSEPYITGAHDISYEDDLHFYEANGKISLST